MRTERRIAVSVANGLVALWFLLGAAAAQGQTVICGSDPCGPGDTNATAILNLEVIGDQVVGDLYDVEFMFDFGADLFTLPLSFPTGACKHSPQPLL